LRRNKPVGGAVPDLHALTPVGGGSNMIVLGTGDGLMIGAICRQDILAHPVITVRCFGWGVFFRSLVAGEHQTFLSLLAEARPLRLAPEKFPELVNRCIELESCAERIYASLARRFDPSDSVAGFFTTLAQQEKHHAELLDLCRAATGREEWNEKEFGAWGDALPGLQEQMREAESRAESLDSLSEALRLVIQIESSEVNRVFSGIMAASDSEFVRTLRVFQEAALDHIAYICERVSEMDPGLRDACRELRDGGARPCPGGCSG
jgi:rubrerythrin